jgi:DNA helicase-2/ATP-dependent DNA helicase PcrA
MRFFADLHLHSRFSRATSRQLTLPMLHAWAQRKGLTVVGTGDITHPEWLEEIADQLVPAEEGLFRLRPELAAEADRAVPGACRGEVRFLLQGEVSSIYKHDGAVRKVHNLVFCPDLAAARRLVGTLDRLGNVRSDGRPILGLSSRNVLEILLESGDGAYLVPAHVWTPWFSILGSKSGYDAVDACFGDLSGHVFALETGLSSDPEMNWRVSQLDRFALLSNSDAHSPANLGREANEFEVPLAYPALFASLRGAAAGAPGFLGTVEFFPEEGKYHLDGHRKCSRRLEPRESRAAKGLCPGCGTPLTIGVLHRVEELADRPAGARPATARPFTRLVPLAEVVGESLGVGPASRRVAELCERVLAQVGPELAVLRDAPPEDVARVAGPLVAEAVSRVREGHVLVEPGYDGEFGTVRIFGSEERRALSGRGPHRPGAPS